MLSKEKPRWVPAQNAANKQRNCSSNILPFTGCSSIPGSYHWRLARGLLVLSDYGRQYDAIRAPRGAYRVPLPEDLIERGEA